jgi:hypothetical protein
MHGLSAQMEKRPPWPGGKAKKDRRDRSLGTTDPRPMMVFRVVTYNLYKCRGLDRRTAPIRIADVLRQVDPDIAPLQEIMEHQACGRHFSATAAAPDSGMRLTFGAAAAKLYMWICGCRWAWLGSRWL